jgi:hypothetical protein
MSEELKRRNMALRFGEMIFWVINAAVILAVFEILRVYSSKLVSPEYQSSLRNCFRWIRVVIYVGIVSDAVGILAFPRTPAWFLLILFGMLMVAVTGVYPIILRVRAARR